MDATICAYASGAIFVAENNLPELVSPSFLKSPERQRVPFNKAFVSGRELEYIAQAIEKNHLAGNGHFTELCQKWLQSQIGSAKAFLTPSCTAALEMASLVADIQPGDEVIMPSFTFVTTASAFVLRGAKPVFVDIRPDTLNLDENLVAGAITEKTKALVPMHYAGVSCNMKVLMQIARDRNLVVIEDAAQALMAEDHGVAVGSQAHLSAISFHETKNIISGEGGALLINDQRFVDKAHTIWEKGTNRRDFFLGRVDKYTWREIGSSFLPNEITAAFLWAQFELAKVITEERLKVWRQYHRLLEPLEKAGLLTRPSQLPDTKHNAHIYYVLVNNQTIRNKLIEHLSLSGIEAVFHYVPLHLSPAGQAHCRSHGNLSNTEDLSARLIRLPLWVNLPEETIVRTVGIMESFLRARKP